MNLSKPIASKKATASDPIGVFDSGVGGISVLKHIQDLLPNERLLYVADSRYAPYGNKTPAEIQARCFAIADFLIAQGAKVLVVACNTATAAAIDALREHYALPIIGMEPAVKSAAEASKNGVVGILATVGTLQSAQFAALLESYGRNVEVVTQACPGLVECIERGEVDSPATRALIEGFCAPLLAHGADTVVLGCTHYPFVRDLIREVVGNQVSLVDTGAAVAKQVKNRLIETNLLAAGTGVGAVRFWTNSAALNAPAVIASLWGQSAKVDFFADGVLNTTDQDFYAGV
ncbi:MAG: glutamate racemase [Methylotenera sp.]|nr:glutamate racemase [Methylotenera sp.]